MKLARAVIIASSVLALFCCHASAQVRSVGLFSTVLGFGLTAELADDEIDQIDIITLRTDLYGVAAGRSDDMGLMLSYTHDYVLYAYEHDWFGMRLHLGAGVAAGYVHDNEGGIFVSSNLPLENPMGVAVALAGNVGLRFDFTRRAVIDFGFSLYPGFHLRTDPESAEFYLSFYRNGVFQAIFPRVRIMYSF